MVTYYLDIVANPRQPRLVRRINNNPGQPVGESLENLQLSYDLVDGLTNPTNIKNPTAPNSPNQIRKVNLFLAGRSNDLYSRTRDYFRNNVATQVSLRSMSFVDRYQ